jgi:hypothetical protein
VKFLRSESAYARDFVQEYVLARALRAGENPYRPMGELASEVVGHLPSANVRRHPSAHPPPVVVAFLPLSFMSYERAGAFWFLLELLGLLICIRWLAAYCGVQGRDVYAVLTLAAIGLPPVRLELVEGQLGVVTLLLLLAMWRSLRSGAAMLGGALLGAAVALKLAGWPIMLFLLLKAQWRSAGAAIAVVAGMNMAAMVGMGVARVFDYYLHIGPSIVTLYRDDSANLSAWAIGWHLFAGTGSSGLSSLRASPLAALPSLAWSVSAVIVVGVLAAAFVLVWRAQKVDDWIGVLVCASVLVNPVVWEHTLILLAIPVAAIVARLRAASYPRGPVALLLTIVGLLIVPYPVWQLIALVWAHEEPVYGNPAMIPFAFSLPTLIPQLAVTGLLLFAAWIARRPERICRAPGGCSISLSGSS